MIFNAPIKFLFVDFSALKPEKQNAIKDIRCLATNKARRSRFVFRSVASKWFAWYYNAHKHTGNFF